MKNHDHELKVLFVIDTLGSGGKERRLTELLKALSCRNDIDFQLVVMSNDIHFTEIYDLGIKIHRIIRKTTRDLSVFRKFYRLIREFNPDAVHCWESMTAVYLAPVCFLLKCRLINGMVTNVPVRQNITNHHWRRGRLTFPFSAKVVSNTRAGLKAYRVPVGKGVVIPNGFNFARLDNITPEKSVREELKIKTDFIVGMVASFTSQKDYPTFFKAAQLILEKRDDVSFMAVGTGTDSVESWDCIKPVFRSNFKLLGNRNDVDSLVNAMDIGLLSSFSEGLSNSILEYMAFGKPVIASGAGGTPEIVEDGVTGYLVPVADPSVMAWRMGNMLDSKNIRKTMGEAGRERVRSRFSMDIMVNKYIDLYKQVAGLN